MLESVHQDLLRYAPRRKIRRLRRAATLFCVAIAIWLLLTVAFLLFQLGVPGLRAGIMVFVMLGLSVASSFVWIGGALSVAIEHPEPPTVAFPLGLRAWVASALLTVCVSSFGILYVSPTRTTYLVWAISLMLTVLSMLFAIGGTMNVMRVLAERFPNQKLASALAWGPVWVFVAGGVLCVIGVMRWSPSPQYPVAEAGALLILGCLAATLIGLCADAVLKWAHGVHLQARRSARLDVGANHARIDTPPAG
ncbi:MAG: hypothetical protein K2W85_00355 [Phycisphaerales bacterium]|nr:hypothetical protein [Phycisphaerales bacterium]